MIKGTSTTLGKWLAQYLNRSIPKYESFDIGEPDRLAAVLRPADVLLVDGNTRVSTAIKYLTQSTWSHAVLFVGDFRKQGETGDDKAILIEADLVRGVTAASLNKYARLNTRPAVHVIRFIVGNRQASRMASKRECALFS